MLNKKYFPILIFSFFVIFFNSSFFTPSVWALGARQEARQERREERREARQEADETADAPAPITPSVSAATVSSHMVEYPQGSGHYVPLGTVSFFDIFIPALEPGVTITPSTVVNSPQSTEVIPPVRAPILSPEQRADLFARIRSIIQERMTPERREELRELFHQWWAEYLTEARKDAIRINAQARVQAWVNSLTPAKKDEFKNRIQSAFQDWWDSVPEDQKGQWKARLREIILDNIPEDVVRQIVEDAIREFLKDAGDTLINIPQDVLDTLTNTAGDGWSLAEDTWKDIFGPVEDAVISPAINWVDDNVVDPVKKVWNHWF